MKRLVLLLLLIPTILPAQNRKKKDYLVTLNTEFGPMRLVLYDQTPKHKENFMKLVNQKFYGQSAVSPHYSQFYDSGGRS